MWKIIGGVDTQTLLAGKRKKELCVVSGSGYAKTFSIYGASTCTPYEPPGETFTT